MRKCLGVIVTMVSTLCMTACGIDTGPQVSFEKSNVEVADGSLYVGEGDGTIVDDDTDGYSSYGLKRDSASSATEEGAKVSISVANPATETASSQSTEAKVNSTGSVVGSTEASDTTIIEGFYEAVGFDQYADDTVEYVCFDTFNLSPTNSDMILPNLSSNTLSVYFYVKRTDNGEISAKAGAAPGQVATISYTELGMTPGNTYEVEIESKACGGKCDFSLNGITQTVKVVVSESEANTDYSLQGEEDGTKFATQVIYDTNSDKWSVTLPAVLYVKAGKRGNSLEAAYTVRREAKGTTITIEHEADKEVNFDGESLAVTFSGKKDTDPILSYTFKSETSEEHTVGPLYYTWSNNAKVAYDCYGVTVFKVSAEKGVSS